MYSFFVKVTLADGIDRDGGRRICINGLDPDTTWAEAKNLIAAAVQLPLEKCKFVHKGKILDDKLGTLYSCRVVHNDLLTVYEKVSRTEETFGLGEVDLKQPAPHFYEEGMLVSEYSCARCQQRPQTKICTTCGCGKCGNKDDDLANVVCEECTQWFHFTCLDPPLKELPEDSWFCAECKNDDHHVVLPGQSTPSLQKPPKKIRGMSNVGHPKKCAHVSPDHRGPIPGISVGQSWKFRAYCGADGVHRPTIAGIAGSVSKGGAVSIVLSDGYPEDVDLGESFWYTGSGGRDLGKGTDKKKRVNVQTFDQDLTGANRALAMTCDARLNKNGAVAKNWKDSLPIRVVRGYKGKKPYAPEEGYRYDGIYKIVQYKFCGGKNGHKVYSYEFQRDDPNPAPWTAAGKFRIQQENLKMVISSDFAESTSTDSKSFIQDADEVTDSTPTIKSDSRIPKRNSEDMDLSDSSDMPRRKVTKIKPPRRAFNLSYEFYPGKNEVSESSSDNGDEGLPSQFDAEKPIPPMMTKSPSVPPYVTQAASPYYIIPADLKSLIYKAMDANPLQRERFESLLEKNYTNYREFIAELNSLFECAICTGFYQYPVTSPCGHISCLLCLSGTINTALGAKCSICRASLITGEPYNDEEMNAILERKEWLKITKVDETLVEIVRASGNPQYCNDSDIVMKRIGGR